MAQAAKQIRVPPIKTQGIKTRLIRFISENIRYDDDGTWIEPFLGSGVVLFNMAPRSALASDSNVHIIALYRSIQDRVITPGLARSFLEREGRRLARQGESYYYEVRDRFNADADPLDFLFLNRSCYNGLVRFNSRGKYNVPFCRKPDRFSKSYITKITNQVSWLCTLFHGRDWRFEAMDWQRSVDCAKRGDFIYLDPPYHGRSTNYYDLWGESDLARLAGFLKGTECSFALSLWSENRYRKNADIERYFAGFKVARHEHFYHVGSTESLRNSMTEALITNQPSCLQ